MITQDEHLVPARPGREHGTLAELTHAKAYDKYGRYGSSPAETNLREYLFIILKRKWLILGLLLVITSLVTIQSFREPSTYDGRTTVKIEAKPKSVLQTGTLVISGQADPNFWGTQLRLLQNQSLARQVVLTLDLPNKPTFFSGQAQNGVFASLKRIFSRDRQPVPSAPLPALGNKVVGEEELKELQLSPEALAGLEPYEDTIIGSETIEPIPGTNLVTIHFVHTDPEMAQQVANTLADVFVQNNLERETSGSTKNEEQLDGEIATLQAKLHQEQEARFTYAKDHNLPVTDTPGSNLEMSRLSTYSAELLQAENERKTYQSIYEAARDTTDPYSIPEVQKDPHIIRLREQISDLRTKREELMVIYTEKYPEVQKIDAELKPKEAELAKAPREVVSAMKARYEAALAHEKSLQASFGQQRGTTTKQTKDQIEMAFMSQDVETDKQYLNTLLQRQREFSAAASTDQSSSVSVSEYGRAPRVPVGPARLRNIAIAFVLSLMAGIGLAFLLDFLDDTVKSIDDVDRYIHLPALALIPAARERPRLRGAAAGAGVNDTTALAMVDDVRSPIAEAYRHLRTSLLLSSAGQPPRTILVTSSQPSEGKTTTAINTAFMLAQTGADVLVIDCDLRRPRLHAHFNLSNARGLTNCLSGEADLDGLLQTHDKLPNLKLLTSGPVPPNPAELLGSDEMRRLLSLLSARFTHIIIDSPPAISFTDASILSTVVDGVILVVHGGRSSRAVVRRAKQQLLDVGAHIFGVVLNNVKLESHNYYYSGYYSSYYSSGYYDEADDPADAGQSPGAAAG
jgi:capsular exopolysaccharide synthesis family protein